MAIFPVSAVLLLLAILPGRAASGSLVRYDGTETFVFHAGIYKPLIWAFRESDGKDDEGTPFENEGEYKFDLKEVVEEKGWPMGVFASVNFLGIVEPRISFEWFKFKYADYNLPFDGSPVDRKDYTIALLLGYDLNRINPETDFGCLYQLYPYVFAGIGNTDYTEKMTVGADVEEGNVVLDDVTHFDLGVGIRYGLIKIINVGAELGIKARDFRTVESPQPSGSAGEGYLRITFSMAYAQ